MQANKPFLTVSAVLVVVMLAGSGCASAPKASWTKYSQAYFPTPVHRIIFPSGNSMDGHTDLRFGPWTVGFGPKPPTAEYSPARGGIRGITIEKLRCEHPVRGEGECGMTLMWGRFTPGGSDDPIRYREACNIFLPSGPWGRVGGFDITCPKGFDFQ